jgi:hypothetical protein
MRVSQKPSLQARTLSQIERMADVDEEPTNDIRAWLESCLLHDPEIYRKLSVQALQWLEKYGLIIT